MRHVHVVVPEGIDDPARPSGGNTYDRQVCRGLVECGWTVREHAVRSAQAVAAIADGAPVLIDGLIAAGAEEVLAGSLLVVLVHMPIGDERERAVLQAAAAVVATSEWARRHLIDVHGLPGDRVHVARPGVDRAAPARGSDGGGALLCVGAVIPGKGHDVLVAALAAIEDLAWTCACVGTLDRDPAFVERVRHDRIDFLGPRTGAALDDCYAAADVLVLPSRTESYGMVIAEALARGLPAIASDVGGVAEALGDGGVLVAPEDPAALGGALRTWLEDADHRARLRAAAARRRAALEPWSATSARIADVLAEVAR